MARLPVISGDDFVKVMCKAGYTWDHTDGAAIMGTRLLTTKECPIHENLKKALVKATETDTMLVMRSVGTHRVWINAAAKKCAEFEAAGASFEEIFKIVSGDNTRKVYQEGEVDAGIVPCG